MEDLAVAVEVPLGDGAGRVCRSAASAIALPIPSLHKALAARRNARQPVCVPVCDQTVGGGRREVGALQEGVGVGE
jgi:hypothetical protein